MIEEVKEVLENKVEKSLTEVEQKDKEMAVRRKKKDNIKWLVQEA